MNENIMIHRVCNYFTCHYSRCSSFWGRLLFRHGETERRQIVSQWIPTTQGLSIIDVGCGDGKFLSSIISGYPKKIVIEDISSSNISEAYQNLKNKAEDVEKHVCNSLIAEFGNFDLVLAIGVFDYYPNWKNFLKKLLLHSQECIIVSLPRIDHLRNWVRFVWFLIHGIQLQMLDRKRLVNAITILGLPFEIQLARFEWFVRIFTNKKPK